MNNGCDKCCNGTAWLFLIIGVIFLLGDLSLWDFWGIQWYTALFVILGITWIAKGSCKECKIKRKKK